MLNAITTFKNDESGAVTVDWVVLTAALVGLGLAVMGVVAGGIEELSTSISEDLGGMDPSASLFGAAEQEQEEVDPDL